MASGLSLLSQLYFFFVLPIELVWFDFRVSMRGTTPYLAHESLLDLFTTPSLPQPTHCSSFPFLILQLTVPSLCPGMYSLGPCLGVGVSV